MTRVKGDVVTVKGFAEKPTVPVAEQLIAEGALWNGGVFAFRLGYVASIARKYNNQVTFAEVKAHYTDYPQISFDYKWQRWSMT